jgi:hypothetical protein
LFKQFRSRNRHRESEFGIRIVKLIVLITDMIAMYKNTATLAVYLTPPPLSAGQILAGIGTTLRNIAEHMGDKSLVKRLIH